MNLKGLPPSMEGLLLRHFNCSRSSQKGCQSDFGLL